MPRRRCPASRSWRCWTSGPLTLDPFFVRGAGLGAGRGATSSGAVGTVAHAVAGALPIGPGLPVVATLLDLASWELPEQYQRTPAARFGHRLRAQLLRDAACVVVGSDAVAGAAVRLLRLRPARVRIVPLAGDDALRPLEAEGTPEGDATPARLAKAVAGPARVLVLGASPDDRASLARQAYEAGERCAVIGRGTEHEHA